MPPPKTRPKAASPTADVKLERPRATTALEASPPETLPEHLRPSRDRIYESVMRGGGEPFGAPFAAGLSSLTQAVVRRIKQKGFFSFETLERGDEDALARNKFTRYGAAPFRGEYARKRKPR